MSSEELKPCNELRKTLRELAEKATPGEWWIDSHGVTMMALDSLEVVFKTPCVPETAVRHPETGNLSNWRNDWDASFIATANPKNILSLLDDYAALHAENERLREALECVKQAGFDCGNDGWGVIHLTNDDWQMVLAALAASSARSARSA